MAEQADAGVGIQPLHTRRINRLPVAVVVEHLPFAADRVRKLQWQAAGGVGGQIQQADVIEGSAAQLWQILAGVVAEVQRAARFGVGAEGGGEEFADRAQFEQGVAIHRLAAFT